MCVLHRNLRSISGIRGTKRDVLGASTFQEENQKGWMGIHSLNQLAIEKR